MSKLDDLIQAAAVQAIADGITRTTASGEPGGAVSRWVRRNCEFRHDTEFFIVTLVCAEIADIFAREEGYRDQCDRAATLAFSKGVN